MLHFACGILKPVVIFIHQHYKAFAVKKICVRKLFIIQVIYRKAQHQLIRHELLFAHAFYAAEFFRCLNFYPFTAKNHAHPAVRSIRKAFFYDFLRIVRKLVNVAGLFPDKFHLIFSWFVRA